MRHARAEQRHAADDERDVGRHRDAPAARRRRADCSAEVDAGRHDHAAERRHDRQRGAPRLAQLAEHQLALDLEPDDEEEHAISPSLIQWSQRVAQHAAAECNPELRLPEMIGTAPEAASWRARARSRCSEQHDPPAASTCRKRSSGPISRSIGLLGQPRPSLTRLAHATVRAELHEARVASEGTASGAAVVDNAVRWHYSPSRRPPIVARSPGHDGARLHPVRHDDRPLRSRVGCARDRRRSASRGQRARSARTHAAPCPGRARGAPAARRPARARRHRRVAAGRGGRSHRRRARHGSRDAVRASASTRWRARSRPAPRSPTARSPPGWEIAARPATWGRRSAAIPFPSSSRVIASRRAKPAASFEAASLPGAASRRELRLLAIEGAPLNGTRSLFDRA